jgi:CHAT domain-containing protein
LAEGASAAEALACAQRNMPACTAHATATNVRKWLNASLAELESEEYTYIVKMLEQLDQKGNEAVFAHPAYWGAFSVTVDTFQLESTARG